MFGFEITSDLLIVAIIAQTIAIALIILITYFKIKKIHHKNIDLNEKIVDKINNLESKLSELSDQILTISTNQDKFNYSVSSMNPSSYYRFKDTTIYESDSLNLLQDPLLESQNIADSEIIDARLTTTSKPKDSGNKSIPIPGTTPVSSSTRESISASTTSVSSTSAKSSLHPAQDSSTQISTSNNPDYTASQNKTINYEQNYDEPINKGLTDNDSVIEKNTNPEIDKIEKEILTALKRLGGDDEGGVGGVGGNDTDTTTKRPDKKSEAID
ncbi:MAG: hypothetical protein H0W19_09845 [Nitrosopumilus sp.]|nr:hypothetical protein [Nitrosopumilus sp.]